MCWTCARYVNMRAWMVVRRSNDSMSGRQLINILSYLSHSMHVHTHTTSKLPLLVLELLILASFKENNERRKKEVTAKCVRLRDLLDYAHKTVRKHALTFSRLVIVCDLQSSFSGYVVYVVDAVARFFNFIQFEIRFCFLVFSLFGFVLFLSVRRWFFFSILAKRKSLILMDAWRKYSSAKLVLYATLKCIHVRSNSQHISS